MSRFTDQMYRRWLGQNGSQGPRRQLRGGMGGMPPWGPLRLLLRLDIRVALPLQMTMHVRVLINRAA